MSTPRRYQTGELRTGVKLERGPVERVFEDRIGICGMEQAEFDITKRSGHERGTRVLRAGCLRASCSRVQNLHGTL